ncbi:MAG TPA: endonuclease/exonuclease/phosphatase family protein [Tepidisphaeraceae bacterium]
MNRMLSTAVLLLAASFAPAEEIRVATYNVEHWGQRFDTRQLAAWAKTQPKSEELAAMIKAERNQDDEDNWEVATVIAHPKLNPDVIFFQEGCGQEDLEYFNKKWMNGAYSYIKVFPSNSGRGQEIGVMIKDGFKVLEVRDQYHLEKDTVDKSFATREGEEPSEAIKENRLFARGPAFVLIQSPSGYKFWAGTNHQKSKSGNDVNVTKWRNREAARTNEIIKDLAKTGVDVIFGGDTNDELGYQEFEQEAGGDAISLLEGKDGQVKLVTRELSDKGEISFGGYSRDRFRSFIDHMYVSKSLAGRVVSVNVYKEGVAPVASDHYPVMTVIRTP